MILYCRHPWNRTTAIYFYIRIPLHVYQCGSKETRTPKFLSECSILSAVRLPISPSSQITINYLLVVNNIYYEIDALSGFEPLQTQSKCVMLPLHHRAI